MLKIGDFSRIGQVSVKTLRYYDEIGLLKPQRTDGSTGYRYYNLDQLPRLNRILALKELGLSLDQIGQLLDEELSAEQLRGILRFKQIEIKERMVEEEYKLARVEARLMMIEQEDEMPDYDVVIKQVDPISVASVRGIIPNYPQQGDLWNELETFLKQQNISPSGPCFTIYHSEAPDVDTEVCEPVDEPVPQNPQVNSHQIPAIPMMATVIHKGPFITLGEAYTALFKWIEANAFQISGPPREVYLRSPDDGSQTDSQTVTEIQFTVEKN